MVETSRYCRRPELRVWYLTASSQVEYAIKAVENGGTSIGIRCKDGVVLAAEKIISSKLLKPGANKRISTVDRNFGVVCLLSCLVFEHRIADHNSHRPFLALSLMADTSFLEPVKKRHHGGNYGSHRYPSHLSPTD